MQDLESAEMSIPQTDLLLPELTAENGSSLDLYSTRQESAFPSRSCAVLNPYVPCANNAPFFALQTSPKSYRVWQGNCHSWSCPRCGKSRAKQEYWRIVNGCVTLAADHDLYFITLTCRGKELSLAESEAGYYGWTNKLLTSMRYQSKKRYGFWHYMQVTERQKRGHPHSHMLTTFAPHDLYGDYKDDWKWVDGKLVCEKKPALRSDWLEQRCISAGLGSQYDISKVNSPDAASRYVAKYLFKPSMFLTEWPKDWHRVRYSRSFPKQEKRVTDAFALFKDEDWVKLGMLADVVSPRDETTEMLCFNMLKDYDVVVREARFGRNW